MAAPVTTQSSSRKSLQSAGQTGRPVESCQPGPYRNEIYFQQAGSGCQVQPSLREGDADIKL